MANFHSISIGEQTEFQRVFAEAGLDANDARRIIKDPTLAADMIAALRKRIPAFPWWWMKAGFQVNKVVELYKEHDWEFMRADVPKIPQEWTPPTPTSVMLLMPYARDWAPKSLPGLQRTYGDMLRSLASSRGAGFEFFIQDSLRVNGLDYLALNMEDWTPGIRWVWFDPDAYRGLSPDEARQRAKADGVRLAGIEILVAMKQFPQWIASWVGKINPLPNLSGLYIERGFKEVVPYLSLHDDTRVELKTAPSHLANLDWTNPTITDC